MSEVLDILQRAAGGFADRLRRVANDDWQRATPCGDWDVRQLVSHVLDEQLWIPPLLAGETVAEVGDRFAGDQLGGDAVAAWTRASADALRLANQEGVTDRTVHLSYGDEAATNYLWQVAADTLIHTWDLARAIGADESLPDSDVSAVHDFLAPQADAWREAGAFGPATPVPSGATGQQRLLALTGRDP